VATFQSVAAFAKEVERLERDVKRHRKDIGTKVADKALPEGYRAAAAKLGGDPKFSGWRGWLQLQARGKDYGAVILPKNRLAAAQWTVAQDGRNAHGGPGGGFLGPAINARSGATNLRFRKSGGVIVRKRTAKRWNGVTQGKGVSDDAKKRFEKVAEPVAEKEFGLILRKHFSVN